MGSEFIENDGNYSELILTPTHLQAHLQLSFQRKKSFLWLQKVSNKAKNTLTDNDNNNYNNILLFTFDCILI